MAVRSHPGLRGVAALGLVALIAAACSGAATSNPTSTAAAPPASTSPSTGQSGTGTADPCALVTSAEAQAAIGVPVATTKGKDEAGYHVCEYASADGRTNLEVTLYDRVGDGEDQTSFELSFAGQPVTGVGSDARFNADLSTLAVLQNGTVLNVGVSNVGSATAAQIQAALTKVAIAALGRL